MKNNLILNENIKKDRVTFGDRLKELRGFFDCTQAEIAEIMGIVPNTIIAYEKNQKNPSIDVALKAAEHFNISLDWLCGFTDKITRIVPMTYADILKKIIEIMNCEIQKEISVSSSNGKIQALLEECKKTRLLCQEGTIDEDLYNIWIEKKLRQYDGIENRIAKNSI